MGGSRGTAAGGGCRGDQGGVVMHFGVRRPWYVLVLGGDNGQYVDEWVFHINVNVLGWCSLGAPPQHVDDIASMMITGKKCHGPQLADIWRAEPVSRNWLLQKLRKTGLYVVDNVAEQLWFVGLLLFASSLFASHRGPHLRLLKGLLFLFGWCCPLPCAFCLFWRRCPLGRDLPWRCLVCAARVSNRKFQHAFRTGSLVCAARARRQLSAFRTGHFVFAVLFFRVHQTIHKSTGPFLLPFFLVVANTVRSSSLRPLPPRDLRSSSAARPGPPLLDPASPDTGPRGRGFRVVFSLLERHEKHIVGGHHHEMSILQLCSVDGLRRTRVQRPL